MVEFQNESFFEFDMPEVKATLLDVAIDKAPFDLILQAPTIRGMTNHIEGKSIEPKAEAPTAGAKRTWGTF